MSGGWVASFCQGLGESLAVFLAVYGDVLAFQVDPYFAGGVCLFQGPGHHAGAVAASHVRQFELDHGRFHQEAVKETEVSGLPPSEGQALRANGFSSGMLDLWWWQTRGQPYGVSNAPIALGASASHSAVDGNRRRR